VGKIEELEDLTLVSRLERGGYSYDLDGIINTAREDPLGLPEVG
jgi:hypothetical protein